MRKEPVFINILIGLENADGNLFSINLIDDNEKLIWRMFVDYDNRHLKTEFLENPENAYLEFILKNFENEIKESLSKVFQLLREYPKFFTWDEEDRSWTFNKPLTQTNLVNWSEYEESKILPYIFEQEESSTFYSICPKKRPRICKKDSKRKKKQKLPSNPSRYNKMELMGKGAYSSVYLVKDSETGNTFVMKQVKKKATKPEKIREELRNIEREIEILKKLVKSCKANEIGLTYFPCYVEDMEDENFIYIITEHIGNYLNLDQYIRKNEPSLTEIQTIFRNLINGLKVLHSKGVIHKDIKPKNILINPKTLEIQYIDFGLSCWACEIECINKGRGTPLYIAPEIYYKLSFNGNLPPYTAGTLKKSDIWALGLVFFYILLRKHPLEWMKTLDSLSKELIKIYNGKSTIPTEEIIDPLFRNIVEGMLSPKPKQRYGLAQIEKLLKPQDELNF